MKHYTKLELHCNSTEVSTRVWKKYIQQLMKAVGVCFYTVRKVFLIPLPPNSEPRLQSLRKPTYYSSIIFYANSTSNCPYYSKIIMLA